MALVARASAAAAAADGARSKQGHPPGVLRKARRLSVDQKPRDTPGSPPMSPWRLNFSSSRSSNSVVVDIRPNPAVVQPVSGHSEPVSAAQTRTQSDSSNESSIYFATDVSYDDDDGLDDFFARRLVRELDAAIKTPPGGQLPHPGFSYASPPLSPTGVTDYDHADYFSPVSPVSMSGRPSMSSDCAAPTWASSSRQQHHQSHAQHSREASTSTAGDVKRQKSKLRKRNRNSNSHPPSAFPGSVQSQPEAQGADGSSGNSSGKGVFRRLTSWKRRSSTDVSSQIASTSSAHSRSNASVVSLPERPVPPYSAYPAQSARPSTSVHQRQHPHAHSEHGHGINGALEHSNSYSSCASAFGTSYDSSAHGHGYGGAHWTPATSVGALSEPHGKPGLPDVLSHIRTQHEVHPLPAPPPLPPLPPLPISPGAARRKPVPSPTPESAEVTASAIGQAFLDLDPPSAQLFPSSPGGTPTLTPDMTPGSSGSLSDQLQTPSEGAALPIRLRPPLPRRGTSRRWTMPASKARAMLCAQEIVETEENYRRVLGQLLRGETTTPPPAKLTVLVPALLAASPRFAAHTPGAAFLAAVPQLEKALVDWCVVAGVFFSPYGAPARGGWKKTWDVASFADSSSSDKEGSRRRLLVRRRHTRALLDERFGLAGEEEDGKQRRKKIPTVQDLAIQPTQRVVRYVLLFRELLEHTHGEDRDDVQQALDAATQLARRCDEALVIIKPAGKS